jgi:uncharacterized protein (TIGR02453 family)
MPESLNYFPGFNPKAFRFFEQLTDNQNRVWFGEHRDEYERHVREPMKHFTEVLSEHLASQQVPLWGDPKRSLFRINRDARFSHAKHPYNMHASGVFTRTGDKHSDGALYFRLDPLGSRIAAGFLQPEAVTLKKLRQGILNNSSSWQVIEKTLAKKGYLLDYSHSLARLPRGFTNVPEELENVLKLKGWIIRKQLSRTTVCSKNLIEEVMHFAIDLLPLLSFGWYALENG